MVPLSVEFVITVFILLPTLMTMTITPGTWPPESGPKATALFYRWGVIAKFQTEPVEL